MSRTPAPATPSSSLAVKEPRATSPRNDAAKSMLGLKVADAVLVALFLALTFLLGVFPLNDTDFWWHLRTGDLIRQNGQVPRLDWYSFGAATHPWIDLHWGFQVGLSWLYQMGGIDATNVAKCVITTLSVAILLFAKRREWPIWVMILTWLPALLLLGGRMYVRPETVSLLYLAIDLAVLFRIGRYPRLAWILPVVQVLWVNTQGLFAFGPLVIMMALIDAALQRGAFSHERRTWWRTVLAACLATGFACLLNPYGIHGALFPLKLIDTMSNPIFKRIMELQPIFDFIDDVGFDSLPLQIHFLTLLLGALSFLVPLVWRVLVRIRDASVMAEDIVVSKRKTRKPKVKTESWTLSPFRLMLYATFSYLSFRATRNSHQFAAVVGTVTAWNFGEWGAAIAERRSMRTPATEKTSLALVPRLSVSALVALAIALVGGGQFYAWAKEGRLVGWGERPLWFAHDASKFAGSPGMPERFVVFHNGLAGLFEYYNSPDQKVFADARLEVMGSETYGEDLDLAKAIVNQQPNWSDRVVKLGPKAPGALLDHVQPSSAGLTSTFLGDRNWRCVWYDPVASVHLHRSTNHPAKTVDFAARHFGKEPAMEPKGEAALAASAKCLMLHAMNLMGKGLRPELTSAMIALGQGHAHRALSIDPASGASWKTLGLIESLRDASGRKEPIPQYRMPFDPMFDLPAIRATYALLRADRLAPNDFMTLVSLLKVFAIREMHEASGPITDRLIASATTRDQGKLLVTLKPEIARAAATAMRAPNTSWKNVGELEQVVAKLLNDGYAESAADVLEKAYPPAQRPWDQTDRIATIRLHLGQPDQARAIWQEAAQVPRPAVRDARVAITYLVEGDFDAARKSLKIALAAEPNSFEAHYGLAILERDAGRANEALASAMSAEKSATTDAARAAAQEIAAFVRPYADVMKSKPAAP